MKIYVLPVDPRLRPRRQPFRYPKHNSDFGVEQDFTGYLATQPNLLTDDPAEADWHYLPVFWTRWHLSHDYGATGTEELQKLVDRAVLNDAKTFTICQYDDGPVVNLGGATMFLASRRSGVGIDIPLLSDRHRTPFFPPRRKYLAAFVGRLSTHEVRTEMAKSLRGRSDVFIHDGNRGSAFFVRNTLAAWVALAPRGYGGSSFRFFEALQLGVVPMLVGDLDTRPFKRFINWDELTLYAMNPQEVGSLLDLHSPAQLGEMGQRCRDFYLQHMAFRKWCPYVIRELEQLR